MKHVFGKFEVDVDDDIGDVAITAMGDSFVLGSQDLTDETTSLVALLMQFCRDRLKAKARPIPLQQALNIAHEAMGDPDGIGLR